METRALANYVVIHGPGAPELPQRPTAWPWTTAALALAAFVAGTAMIVVIERTIVAPLPAVQAAEATHQVELRHAKFRSEAQPRLAALNHHLMALGEEIGKLETILRDKLGLSGNGVKYEDFDRPIELDRVVVDSAAASDEWDRIQSALLVRQMVDRLTHQAASFSRQLIFEASDLTAIASAVGEAESALERVKAGQDAANRLSKLLRDERARSSVPANKEP